jgi:hypothetical protein
MVGLDKCWKGLMLLVDHSVKSKQDFALKQV